MWYSRSFSTQAVHGSDTDDAESGIVGAFFDSVELMSSRQSAGEEGDNDYANHSIAEYMNGNFGDDEKVVVVEQDQEMVQMDIHGELSPPRSPSRRSSPHARPDCSPHYDDDAETDGSVTSDSEHTHAHVHGQRSEGGVFWSQFQSLRQKQQCSGGTNIYELYSVLVHEGGTHGGHYYAYIKVTEAVEQ